MLFTSETMTGAEFSLLMMGLASYAKDGPYGIWPRTCARVQIQMVAARELLPPGNLETMLDWTNRLVREGLIKDTEADSWLAALEISANRPSASEYIYHGP